MEGIFRGLHFLDAVDVLVVAVALYALVRAFSRAESRPILIGLLLLVPLFALARALSLRLVASLFELLFPVLLVVLVVLFQEDLRRLLERVGARRFLRRVPTAGRTRSPALDVLVRSLPELARDRIGALVVLEGEDPLDRHLSGGESLDAVLSVPLVKSLFDPHSEGHDGALVLSGGRARRFAAHLPLSDDADALAGRGTRHAAALGISERTDALALVVSEERGTISAAEDGRLVPVEGEEGLAAVLDRHAGRTGAAPARREAGAVFRRHLPQKALALAAAVLLWFFAVHEATIEYREFQVPVETTGAPEGWRVEGVSPSRARIIVSGTRRAFYFVDAESFTLTAKLFEIEPGADAPELTLTASDVSLPAGIGFVNIVPRTVVIRLRRETR